MGVKPNVLRSVESRLRKSGRFYVCQGKDGLWATDAYWALPVNDVHPIALILGDYNLSLAPGIYTVGRTIKPGMGEPPKIDGLIKPLLENRVLVDPFLVGSVAALAAYDNTTAAIMQREDGPRVAVNSDFLGLFSLMGESGGRWEQAVAPPVAGDVSLQPLAWCVGSKVRGLLMPIRMGVNEATQKKVA